MKTVQRLLKTESTFGRSAKSSRLSVRVVKILPHLPPATCGVADHATAVGNALNELEGVEVSYIGVNQGAQAPSNTASLVLQRKSSEELLSVLRGMNLPRETVVVLHYSAYSLGKRGVCFWVPKALKRFKDERPDVLLMTMFHELWSPAPLLSKSGWVVPLQKMAIRSLAKVSDVVRTNRVEYRRQLEKICPSQADKVRVKNICSNFGEPKTIPRIHERKRQVVIFQPPDLGTSEGQTFWQSWQVLRDKLNVKATIVAGRVKQIPEDESIVCRGFVSAAEGSELLLESQFVLFGYYDGYLGKSSFFGSIAAHGIVPVMPDVNSSEDEGLIHRTHYLTAADNEVLDESKLEQLSIELQDWYSEHSISATAQDYIDSMRVAA